MNVETGPWFTVHFERKRAFATVSFSNVEAPTVLEAIDKAHNYLFRNEDWICTSVSQQATPAGRRMPQPLNAPPNRETLDWCDVSLGTPAPGVLVLAQDADGFVHAAGISVRGNWTALGGEDGYLDNVIQWAEWPKGPQV